MALSINPYRFPIWMTSSQPWALHRHSLLGLCFCKYFLRVLSVAAAYFLVFSDWGHRHRYVTSARRTAPFIIIKCSSSSHRHFRFRISPVTHKDSSLCFSLDAICLNYNFPPFHFASIFVPAAELSLLSAARSWLGFPSRLLVCVFSSARSVHDTQGDDYYGREDFLPVGISSPSREPLRLCGFFLPRVSMCRVSSAVFCSSLLRLFLFCAMFLSSGHFRGYH